MNIIGNVRYQFTEDIIEKAVFNILRRKDYDSFTVKDVCAEAAINRSSFYAHYQDINDLMIKIEKRLTKRLETIWKGTTYDDVFVEMFRFVKEHKYFYKAFLRSHNQSFTVSAMLEKQKSKFRELASNKGFNYSESEIGYHLYFFGGGLKAVCGLWVQNDCKETPEQMAKTIHDEYSNNAKYF